MTKRVLDVAIALALMPFAAPLCVCAMVAVRVESPGSPLFTQLRVGRDHRPFQLYKLRTMRAATGDVPSHQVDAAQITRVGAFLRRTKLDELPQLLNVLNGTMSLVGPRPCLPSQHELLEERDRRGLYAFLPGVTGPAQLLGIDMSAPKVLAQVEADYFFTSTAAQDLGVLWQTAAGGGRGDAAKKRL
jgi:O-antigen biosynthesis protein WbqP